MGSPSGGQRAIAEKAGALQPCGSRLTPSSQEREPVRLRWRREDVLYISLSLPGCESRENRHAASDAGDRPIDRAEPIALARGSRERNGAGRRAAAERHRDVCRRLLL